MSNLIFDLKNEAASINHDLELSKKTLHETKMKAKLDKKTFDKTKDLLKSAQSSQKFHVSMNEKDDKRFKALRKYGDALRLVENLLGLIPSNLNNLSTEELEEKLQELLKSRRNNETQMLFIFYQNMITDLLTNLISIEKDCREQRISTRQAYEYIQESKQQIKECAKEAPNSLQQTIKDASDLVRAYEQNYNAFSDENHGPLSQPLKTTELSSHHRESFEDLNKRTSSLIANVGDLSNDISHFEPQVNLSPIADKLEQTEFILRHENWDVKEFNSAVKDLESTTVKLTDKQTDLNRQNEKIETTIKKTSKEATDLSSIKDFSADVSFDLVARINQTERNIVSLEGDLNQNDDFLLFMVPAFACAIESQFCADEAFGATAPGVVNDPNCLTIDQLIANARCLSDTVLLQKNALLVKTVDDKKG